MIELMTSTLALATGDPDAPWIPEKYRALILICSIPGLYCLMLLLGRWLKRSNRALGGVAPIAAMDTEIGARQVENILGRIAYGGMS